MKLHKYEMKWNVSRCNQQFKHVWISNFCSWPVPTECTSNVNGHTSRHAWLDAFAARTDCLCMNIIGKYSAHFFISLLAPFRSIAVYLQMWGSSFYRLRSFANKISYWGVSPFIKFSTCENAIACVRRSRCRLYSTLHRYVVSACINYGPNFVFLI